MSSTDIPIGDESAARTDSLFINSIEKGMAVLQAIGQRAGGSSLGEIAAATGMTKSAAQRVTHTLHTLGYLEKDAETRHFALSTKVLDFSFNFLQTHPLVELATPHLVELRRNCQERVDLSVRDNTSIVYLIRMQSRRETLRATLVGRRLPMFCTSGGRAMLACMPESEALDIVERSERRPITPKTITDTDAVMQLVREARQNGFAVVLEESLIGEIALAAAVLDQSGRPIAAVHIAGSLSEWTMGKFIDRNGPLVVETVQSLHRSQLGENFQGA